VWLAQRNHGIYRIMAVGATEAKVEYEYSLCVGWCLSPAMINFGIFPIFMPVGFTHATGYFAIKKGWVTLR